VKKKKPNFNDNKTDNKTILQSILAASSLLNFDGAGTFEGGGVGFGGGVGVGGDCYTKKQRLTSIKICFCKHSLLSKLNIVNNIKKT
jgi:hypothetical protein